MINEQKHDVNEYVTYVEHVSHALLIHVEMAHALQRCDDGYRYVLVEECQAYRALCGLCGSRICTDTLRLVGQTIDNVYSDCASMHYQILLYYGHTFWTAISLGRAN